MQYRSLRAGTLAALLLIGVIAPTGAAAEPTDSQREHNFGILGLEAFDDPVAREPYEMLQYTPDPIEGVNRFTTRFITLPFVDYVGVPIVKAWRFVTPEFLRRSLVNFQYNITYPGRLVSLLLQGEMRKSGHETSHFLVNTTAGILGLFDRAKDWNIPTYRQDTGLAFARWGSGPGFFLSIPLLGPSSGRDGLGLVFDSLLDPLTYFFPARPLFTVNGLTFRVDGYETLRESSRDFYLASRALWAIQRQTQVERYEIPPEAYATSAPEPSLGNLLLQLEDPDFARSGDSGKVRMPNGGKLPYSAWIQGEPSPLLFIIPGIGGHRNGRAPLALAEKAFSGGYSVVTVSSPFNPEFILNGLTETYPGNTPHDAEDLYAALSGIREKLGPRVTTSTLFGYSMGGIESLFLAAAANGRPQGALHFERVVAANPPVDLRYAGSQFDAYFDAPLRWPAEERDQRVQEVAMKAFLVARETLAGDGTVARQAAGSPAGPSALPFDREESEFLIGLSGRTTLINALQAIDQRGDATLEIPRNERDGERGPLLSVVNRSSLRNYADELAIPYYLGKTGNTLSRDELARSASLYAIEDTLRSDKRIRIFHNVDDFIVSGEEMEWLRDVMGERLKVFPGGGHLGNLHRPEVLQAIGDAVRGADR